MVPEKKNTWGMILSKKGSEENKQNTEKCPENEPKVTFEYYQFAVWVCWKCQ